MDFPSSNDYYRRFISHNQYSQVNTLGELQPQLPVLSPNSQGIDRQVRSWVFRADKHQHPLTGHHILTRIQARSLHPVFLGATLRSIESNVRDQINVLNK